MACQLHICSHFKPSMKSAEQECPSSSPPCYAPHAVRVEARKASDFSKFAPALQTWVDLSKEKAACLNPDAPAYDVLLDNYERGMTSERLKTIFAEVGGWGGICLSLDADDVLLVSVKRV